MIAIRSFAKDPQAKVDLTIWENDHDFKLYWRWLKYFKDLEKEQQEWNE